MGAVELRNKLINQFNNFLQDESKLDTLSGIFDAMNTNSTTSSRIPESHYKKVEKRRERHHSGETTGKSWELLKQELKNKYEF